MSVISTKYIWNLEKLYFMNTNKNQTVCLHTLLRSTPVIYVMWRSSVLYNFQEYLWFGNLTKTSFNIFSNLMDSFHEY